MILSIPSIRKSQRGFTLLELLMVVTILSAVAWMAIGVVDNNSDQIRFEDTRNRLEMIRRAIIGDTSRTINGQPEIRGYVADMGNLPPSLQALIQQDYCKDYPAETNAADCTTAGGNWIEQGKYCTDHTSNDSATCTGLGFTWISAYSYDTDFGIWSGWNGPYLQAKELTGYSRFRDGWSNVAATPTNNFGWLFSASSGNLTVRSYGKEGIADVAGTSGYDLDYPPATASDLIQANDYKVDLGSSSINLTLAPSSLTLTDGLCLKIARIIDGEVDDSSPSYPSVIYSTISSASLPTWDGTPKQITFTGFNAFSGTNTDISLGKLAYQVTDYSTTATPICTNAIGTNNGTASNWRSFTFVPKAALPDLFWNAP